MPSLERIVCNDCSNYVLVASNTNVEVVCSSCASNYYNCDSCEGLYNGETECHYVESEEVSVCESCYSSNYSMCSSCEGIYSNDNLDGVRIFNEKQGHWRDGAWFSNNGYQYLDLGWGQDSLYMLEEDLVSLLEERLPDNNPSMKNRIITLVDQYLEDYSYENQTFATDNFSFTGQSGPRLSGL